MSVSSDPASSFLPGTDFSGPGAPGLLVSALWVEPLGLRPHGGPRGALAGLVVPSTPKGNPEKSGF